MGELDTLRQEYAELFDRFMKHAALETKHSVKARQLRHKCMVIRDEIRAMERDMLSLPITR